MSRPQPIPAPPVIWIDVGGTFTDCVVQNGDGSLRTFKLLSSGVFRGQVGEGSTRDAIVDPLRGQDPAGFFTGWRLSLQAAAPAARAEPARTSVTPTDADDAVAGATPASKEEVRIADFDAATSRLVLARPLRRPPVSGAVYELRCDDPAPVIGIRWLLGTRGGQPVEPVHVHLGTTRGTNALLERRGARTALVTTAGFADMLEIGYQQRPHLFELHIRKPRPLYEQVVEVDERVAADGHALRPLDEHHTAEQLRRLHAAGIESVAVCLLNSYRNPDHEQRVAALARQAGFRHVCCSSVLTPVQRIVPRGETAVINAYLAPVIEEYFHALRRALPRATLKVMTSAGALVRAAAVAPKDTVLSGPAGGVVGAARVAATAGFEQAIGFDMGGTSTDVSRYSGQFERRYEMEIGDRETGGSLRLVSPALRIETVAAGGGSVCGFDGTKPIVGPRSAGADPGPACYGRGGPLCVTDANVYLGRVLPDHFPFPLDRNAVAARLTALIEQIAAQTGRRYPPEELAAGYVTIANTHMAAAIRQSSVQRGYDPRDHVLVSFGGAGGQHACALARALGMTRILLHPCAGVLSAYGIGMADVSRFAVRDVGRPLSPATLGALEPLFVELEAALRREVQAEGIAAQWIAPARRQLDLRYQHQDTTLTIDRPPDDDWRTAFERQHRAYYGFVHAGRAIEVRSLRLEVTGQTAKAQPPALTRRPRQLEPLRWTRAYFTGGWHDTPVYERAQMQFGDRLTGPAIVLEATGTVIIETGWDAEMTDRGDLLLRDRPGAAASPERAQAARGSAFADCDPITLELFYSHFTAIAEQMGAVLQRTAVSTNVKERLDFSCAVYDAAGQLVSHAPHIPVHIGAMGACVKHLVNHLAAAGTDLAPAGTVYVTNDPYHGGSHLPDVTVITPVHASPGEPALFYVASRAHHAEIGGIEPGSMPARSRTLAEEGVRIPLTALVCRQAGDEGSPDARLCGEVRVQDDLLRGMLCAGPYPSRSVEDNLADVYAQIAANQRGARLLTSLVARQGLAKVQAYMRHIQAAAEAKMRAALQQLGAGNYRFQDQLDDGAAIVVQVTIEGGSAEIDFAGTAGVHAGNLNATPAIVASAVLYCFRCLIGADIPLNSGVMAPLTIHVPEGLLNPPWHPDPRTCAAVAGGNVETSQRIVDCLFGALGVVAASQGTMNNLSFGDERFGYYETIAGGAGAGPAFPGADAVHTHMTNTRMTDPEVLEDRYPVRLRRFVVRRGSGGAGRQRGGDGLIREIEFLAPLDVSLLTQRRTRRPYGLAGGMPGAAGENTLIDVDGVPRRLDSVTQFRAAPGAVLQIATPGGGGFGQPDRDSSR